MSFSNHLRKLAQPIWRAQLAHPFVVALGNGTLVERKFRYYILQDARFLGDLARVFSAGCSARAGFGVRPAVYQTRRGNHHRGTKSSRQLRRPLEDDAAADVIRPHGPHELRLYPAYAGRCGKRKRRRDHGRRSPLRLDLLRGGQASAQAGRVPA